MIFREREFINPSQCDIIYRRPNSNMPKSELDLVLVAQNGKASKVILVVKS